MSTDAHRVVVGEVRARHGGHAATSHSLTQWLRDRRYLAAVQPDIVRSDTSTTHPSPSFTLAVDAAQRIAVITPSGQLDSGPLLSEAVTQLGASFNAVVDVDEQHWEPSARREGSGDGDEAAPPLGDVVLVSRAGLEMAPVIANGAESPVEAVRVGEWSAMRWSASAPLLGVRWNRHEVPVMMGIRHEGVWSVAIHAKPGFAAQHVLPARPPGEAVWPAGVTPETADVRARDLAARVSRPLRETGGPVDAAIADPLLPDLDRVALLEACERGPESQAPAAIMVALGAPHEVVATAFDGAPLPGAVTYEPRGAWRTWLAGGAQAMEAFVEPTGRKWPFQRYYVAASRRPFLLLCTIVPSVLLGAAMLAWWSSWAGADRPWWHATVVVGALALILDAALDVVMIWWLWWRRKRRSDAGPATAP